MGRNQQGNAVLLTVVATAALSSALVVISNRVSMRAKTIQSQHLKSGREQLYQNISRLMTVPEVIKASAHVSNHGEPGNQKLAACLYNSGSADCNSTGINSFTGFKLFDEFNTPYTSSWPEEHKFMVLDAQNKWPGTLARFAGIDFPLPQYDKNVKRCTPPDRCSLAPFTAFRAWCAQPVSDQMHKIFQNDGTGLHDNLAKRPTSCDVAEYIQFFVVVGGASFATGDERPMQAAIPAIRTRHNFFISSPSELGSKTRDPDEIVVSVNEINSNGAMLCPTGMSTVGIDANGRPRCEFAVNPCVATAGNPAASGFIMATNENGKLVCRKPFQGERCKPLEAFYGVDSSGKMICKKPKFSTGCKDKELLVSFNDNGEPICIRSHVDQYCQKPAIMVGFDVDGFAICKSAETIYAGIPITPYWK